jgi:monovalent cation:H+ antiporter-2, CPA2 family
VLFDLATAITAALIGAFVALSLRQSVIVGFLLAGVVIGPHTPGFIGDADAVESLAEVGIVFLMFVIGVQLSFSELMRAGRVALVGASCQVLVTIGGGYLLGRLVGFGPLESIFFGAVVSNSSSTVLGKVLAEREQTESGPGRTALAWSSVQDLGTLVLVAVLGALATAETPGVDLGRTLGKTAVFLGVLVPLALFVLPRLLGRVAALRNREIFVLAAGCIALGMSYISGLLGVSTALGAFLAGAIVGDSKLAHRILGETLPLRDLFSGLFFVSIGMLIDPAFVVQHLPLVLLCAGCIVLLKGTVTVFISRLLGSSWTVSLAIGAGLAQSGEFSLLMARLGQSLGAVSALVFNVLLAGTAASILVAPHLHRVALPLARVLARRQEESDAEAPMPTDLPTRGGHVVVCGHGRVGQVVANLLRLHEVPFVVIDEDHDVVRPLRDAGVHALLGDASRPELLERAGVARAKMVVVAIPDRTAVRQILDHARDLHQALPIVVRTHSDDERRRLYENGADEAVMGELELALELGRRALELSGVAPGAAQAAVDGVRREQQS